MSIFRIGAGVAIDAVERGLVPDAWTRAAIRRMCRQRLNESGPAEQEFAEAMRRGPIAPLPHKANDQHYELPAEFFTAVLGPRRKYSCCLWPDGTTTLAEAEDAALAETCRRAEFADGQEILELGCGWGSLSLWMAERYPRCRITAVSNSSTQRAYIESLAKVRGISNVRVITADMNSFSPSQGVAHAGFDRIISIEMFEHMRNYEQLLARIATWLRPEGKLFVHLFCHRERPYEFAREGEANWMGRHFFSGGIMPSANLIRRFDRDLTVVQDWHWNGRHYHRTAEAWLANLDARLDAVIAILRQAYGREDARRWLMRWRVFFLAVSEMFAYGRGEEWFVAHYLLARRD
jgi:cyclopropane-fatty-acyl-phospholipid synthase